MKLIENIKQELFVRDNNLNGYQVILEGDVSISTYTANNIINIWDGTFNNALLDTINLDDVMKDVNFYTRSWIVGPDMEARISITKEIK
jgi:hypothetical protein